MIDVAPFQERDLHVERWDGFRLIGYVFLVNSLISKGNVFITSHSLSN